MVELSYPESHEQERSAGSVFLQQLAVSDRLGYSSDQTLMRVNLHLDGYDGRVILSITTGTVVLLGLEAAVVESHLLEVREDREGELRRPGVPPQLEGWARISCEVYGGLLRLDEELPCPTDVEAVVRCFGCTPNPDGILGDDLPLRTDRDTTLIGDVPTQGLEEWVDEVLPDPLFLVSSGAVGLAVGFEPLDQIDDPSGNAHVTPPSSL